MQIRNVAEELETGKIDEQQAADRLDAISARIRNFLRTTEPNIQGKHEASKPGFIHSIKKVANKKRSGDGLTNHERVVAGRAKRLGISVEEYRRRFSAS
jgi:hypothetical protein